MNWKEAKDKWQKEKEKWEIIKKDFPQYEDFLKQAYLVVCWDHGQADFNDLYPLELYKHIDLIKQEGIKKELLNLLNEISRLQKTIDEMKKRISRIQWLIIQSIENKAELVENRVEVRFRKLNFESIAALKKHPLVNKDSYGIRIILE